MAAPYPICPHCKAQPLNVAANTVTAGGTLLYLVYCLGCGAPVGVFDSQVRQELKKLEADLNHLRTTLSRRH